MVKSTGPLTVRLTEPITFLRGSATGQDFRGRPQILPHDASPAMVRGLLTLKLTKASRIKKIEISLRGISRTEWPEGIGPRRLDTSEEHIIISETVTFFTASASHSRSRDRRAVSVGPGSYIEEEYDDDGRDADDEAVGAPGVGEGRADGIDRGRAPQRGGAGRSFSVGGDRLANAMNTMPSSRRQSFDRETRPDVALHPNGSGSGSGRSGGPSAHALREAILTRDRGPSPAYSPQDPLHTRHARAHSLLRHERPDMSLEGLSPIESAVQSETSRDPSREPPRSGPTRPSVGPPNAGIAPRRGRIPSLSNNLDEVAESDSSAQTRRDTTFSTSSQSTASSLRTASHPTSPSVEEPSAFALDAPQGSANEDRDRRDSTATQRQEHPAPAPPLPPPQEEYISVSRRGSRQTSLVELIPSPAHSPSLRPVDGRARGAAAQGSSASSSRRSSGVGTRPSISQLRPSYQNSSVGNENAVASSSLSREERGRKSSKFSLSGVSSALRGLSQDVKERVSHGRATSRVGGKEKEDSHTHDARPPLSTHGSDPMIPPYGRGGAGLTTRRASSPPGDERSSSRARGRNKGLKALNGALGLDEDFDGGEDGTHKWKEFRKGTYNYPISFAIAASSPPTIHADFGSVTYRLRATVFRAGALTPNLVEDTEVLVLASPNEDDMEESENIIVERQWEDQMRYLIALSGKSFPIGGHIPISVRMMPLSKCKIYRLSVTIEEKVDYFALERKVTRHEAVKKYPLLSLKGGTDKQAEPLLPIISDSPTALADSPLAPLAAQARQSNEDEDDAVASLLNPHGPWFLESTLQVPDCQSRIRFSTKHAKTNMAIAHWLKVVIRVERGDDKAVDSKGRRKQFDIIIETPLHLLDCRVNTQFNTLPTYSTASPATVATSSQCSVHGGRHVGNDSRIGSGAGGAGPSGAIPRSASAIPAVAALVAAVPTGERRASEVSPARNDEGDTLLERNIVYDRLVSGQESEAGEAPPTYIEALSARHGSRSRSRQASGSRSRSRLGDAGSADSLAI